MMMPVLIIVLFVIYLVFIYLVLLLVFCIVFIIIIYIFIINVNYMFYLSTAITLCDRAIAMAYSQIDYGKVFNASFQLSNLVG